MLQFYPTTQHKYAVLRALDCVLLSAQYHLNLKFEFQSAILFRRLVIGMTSGRI